MEIRNQEERDVKVKRIHRSLEKSRRLLSDLLADDLQNGVDGQIDELLDIRKMAGRLALRMANIDNRLPLSQGQEEGKA